MGLVLGLVGGGGSILAVPLLVYGVGVTSIYLAIGTSAIAVSISAFGNLFAHSRAGNVKWRCAFVFAAAGVIGALGGAQAGKGLDGQKLLALFGAVMIVVGAMMLRERESNEDADVRLTTETAKELFPLLLGIGFAVGLFGLLWHRRRLSDRAGIDPCNRHAADLSDRHFSRCHHRLRSGNGR